MAKVMIVEDEKEYMARISRIVEGLGHVAVECHYGGNALIVYSKEMPDMVVTDFACGGITGADITRQIRKRGSEVPVYIQSRRPIPDVLVSGSGANGFILKDNLDVELPTVLKKYFGDVS